VTGAVAGTTTPASAAATVAAACSLQLQCYLLGHSSRCPSGLGCYGITCCAVGDCGGLCHCCSHRGKLRGGCNNHRPSLSLTLLGNLGLLILAGAVVWASIPASRLAILTPHIQGQ